MSKLENIEATVETAFADLRRVINEYEQEIARTELPFVSYQYPERIKTRLKLIASLTQERQEALREERQP